MNEKALPPRKALPPWLKKRLPADGAAASTAELLQDLGLATVCQGAKCPNIWECFSRKVATFMILGDRCTRNCRFCGVFSGDPLPPDPDEPKRVAEAVKKLELRHVVITCVTRDDLSDGGAAHFAETITAVRSLNPGVTIEVLTSDFQGDQSAIRKVADQLPEIYNHNVETVARLYPQVRPQADYRQSLDLLKFVKENYPSIHTKSGLMAGLGETFQEVEEVLQDLHRCGCSIVTIGQYLQPSPEHLEVVEFIPPEVFEKYSAVARRIGFLHAYCGPFVRSSYNAAEFVPKI